MKVLVQPESGSLEAIATAERSSRSVSLEEQFGAAAVEFHVAEFVEAEQVDAAVAGHRLRQLLVVGCFDEFVDQLRGEGVADAVAGLGGRGPEGDQQVRLAGAAVADEAERLPGLDPAAGGELVNDGGVDGLVGVEVELLDAFGTWESGVVDPPRGSALVAVVALGHDQLGEEPEVGQLLALRRSCDLAEPFPDRGQPQHATALLDRSGRGLLGYSALAAGHELALPSRSS